MQMTADPVSVGTNWTLAHTSAGSDYNPANPGGAFTNPVNYDVGDVVYNLGTFGMRAYRVICNDAAAPSLTNTCILGSSDAITGPANPTIAEAEALASQVVDFQVQYGVAPARRARPSTRGWTRRAAGPRRARPTSAASRPCASRSSRAATSSARWSAPPRSRSGTQRVDGVQRTKALTDDERYYRYKVQTVVVPLINMIWAGV